MTRPALIDVPATNVPPSRPFFAKATGREFTASTKGGATLVDFFDEVGVFGISAGDFQARLREIRGDITLRINSPGGDVFDGLAIFNSLAAHKGKVRVEIVGLAASIASVIAMAGDEIAIAENAFMMVHSAWTLSIGNAVAHDETAAVLRQIDSSMLATYVARTGGAANKIAQMMAAETWLNADAAMAAGFADETIGSRPYSARFDMSNYANTPTAFDAAIERDNPTIRDIETALRDAGFSRSQARALAARGHHGTEDELRDAADIADLAAHISALSIN